MNVASNKYSRVAQARAALYQLGSAGFCFEILTRQRSIPQYLLDSINL